MKNWSRTIEKFDKKSDQYEIWKLEQLINFGLDGEKLSRYLLKKHFSMLEVDNNKKTYLKYLLKDNK